MRRKITMKGEFLVLAHTPNDAKQIENQLRGSGHSVHVLVAPGLDSFIDILEKSEICIAIHDIGFTESNLLQVSEAVNRLKPDVPLLQLDQNMDPRTVTEAMSKGARDVISLNSSAHMEMVLQQAYELYSTRQDMASLKLKIADLETVRKQDLGTTAAPGFRVQEGIVVAANKALASALGAQDPDELIGMPLMDLVLEDDVEDVKRAVKLGMKSADSEQIIPFTLVGENGLRRHLEARFIRIEHEGEPALEVRGLEAAEPAMAAGASSGPPGRHALVDAVSRQPSSSEKLVSALIFAGIDDFDQLEQRAGYVGAEDVVSEAMRMLGTDLRAGEQAFRFSDHEFTLLARRETTEALRDLVTHFQRSVARHIFKAGDKELATTASAVVYPLSGEEDSIEDLLRKLRGETRGLQSQGGNGLRVLGNTAEELERRQRSAAWLARIQEALKNNRFELAFQNIASLAGEERQFSDILLRMLDDGDREILAREFMPSAEEHGLMPQIDRWVIQRVATVIEQQLKDGSDPCFFVRIAEDTLAEGQTFVDWIEGFVKQHARIAGHLVLVIREAHLQDHMKRAQTLINKLRALKLQTALDHFGNSRHSAQIMSNLKVDYIKLHADFTAAVASGGGDNETLQTIMDQAKQFQVKTIAERVTDANSMARLWQLGVNYIMGSHVHEPDSELTSTRFRLG